MVSKISEQCCARSPESQLPSLGRCFLPKSCSLPGQEQQSVGRWHWESVPSAETSGPCWLPPKSFPALWPSPCLTLSLPSGGPFPSLVSHRHVSSADLWCPEMAPKPLGLPPGSQGKGFTKGGGCRAPYSITSPHNGW